MILTQLWKYLGRVLLPLRLRLAHLIYRDPSFKRGVMRLDPWTVIKMSFSDVAEQEAAALTFVRQRTSIPVPKLFDSWIRPRGPSYTLMSMCPGVELGRAWSVMSSDARARTATELRSYIEELRALPQPAPPGWVGSTVHGQVSCPRISMAGPEGPWDTIGEFHTSLLRTLGTAADTPGGKAFIDALSAYQHKVVYSHADLSFDHILVDPQTGRVTAIVDWAMAGWWPEYWEYRKAMYGGRPTHKWWVKLLDEVMTPYTDELLLDDELEFY